MSKISKLIKTPKKYFLDSNWFKINKLNVSEFYENLFVISHLGQLNQVEELIKYENLKDCFLVILYTRNNLRVPESIQTQINKKLFSSSLLFLLPNSPNNFSFKSLVFMNNNYRELLSVINPKNLYLLSFENHYSLLANNAKAKKINISLIDEGTATYKSREQSEYYTKQNILKKIIAKLLNINSAFNWFTEYDKVYASFPELLSNNFQANSFNRFFSHAGNFNTDFKTRELIRQYNITSKDFLYVNQRYAINDNDFVNAILIILSKINEYYDSRVFIKMHPKDSPLIKKCFMDSLVNYKNIIFIKENEFMIEPTIQLVKPKGVIGLTSTSLVYAPLVSPNTKVYSIQPWFLDLIPNKNNKKGIKIIVDHFEILRQFNHIIILDNKNDLDNRNDLNMINTNTVDKNIYNNIANQAYEEKKYKKATINYIWAYPNGIESMPIGDFTKYIESFYNINGIKLSKDIINSWIETEIQRNDKKEIEKYSELINRLSKVISKENEYSNAIFTKDIYNSIMVLITSTTTLNIFSINLIEVELHLKDEKILPLLEMKAEKLFIESKYEESMNIYNNIFKYLDYVNKNEKIYISLLKNLIKLKKTNEVIKINNRIQEEVTKEEIKLLSSALVLVHEKNYELALSLLESKIEIFNDVDKSELKVELLISKIYRYLEDYGNAKLNLLRFVKHSKGNIICHREIAYLEYKFENYSKVISQYTKAYPNGIESMPIGDFTKYIESFYNISKFNDVYNISKGRLYNTEIQYYYLVSLNILKLDDDFIKYINILDMSKSSEKRKEQLILLTIESLRRLGNIESAFLILNKNNNIIINDLKYYIVFAEVCELSEDFRNANYFWKAIICKFKDSMPTYSWDRYYHTLNMIKD